MQPMDELRTAVRVGARRRSGAECFWAGHLGEIVSPRCRCGIRSMATLPPLAEWMHNHVRHVPEKATVVGPDRSRRAD